MDELKPEEQETVDALVDDVNEHIRFISASHAGMAISCVEVLANAVYWGSLLTRYYPRWVDIASLFMAKLEILGELVQPGDDRIKPN